MEVKEKSKVKVHYVGKLEDNSVFDSSVERKEPIDVEIGVSQLIPGFVNGIMGLKAGDKKTINIAFTEAYGPVLDDRIQEVEKSLIPEDVTVGQALSAQTPEGEINVVVTKINDETVTLDGNHPLAGKNLIFDIEIVEVV